MPEIKLGKTIPTTVIVLTDTEGNEHRYKVKPFTQEIEDELGPIEDAMTANLLAENDQSRAPKERVGKLCEQLDVMLEAADGTTRKPSDVIGEAYDALQTTSMDISALVRNVVQACAPPL